MAVIYLRSTDGSDSDNGSTWALAKATLAAALTAAGAGGTVYVSQAHAETQAAAMTLASPGTAASPTVVLCVNDAAEPPTTLATTATVTTTGNNDMTLSGHAFYYGISFRCASGGAAFFTVGGNLFMDTCDLQMLSTAAQTYYMGAADGVLELRNCTLSWGSDLYIFAQGIVRMFGGSVAATGTVPTNLFRAAYACDVRFRGVNLSAFGAGKAFVSGGESKVARFSFEQCQLAASVALTSVGPSGSGDEQMLLENSDSGDTQVRFQRTAYEGDVYSETTLVRTGGASNGTTPLAHKMVSSANPELHRPLYGPEIVLFNAAIGSSKTATVEILRDSATALTDAEVWLEVEYLGTSGVPRSSFVNDRVASHLASPADQTTSSVAWTTTGMSNPNKQKLAVTFTPQEVGILRCRVALAKASTTVYVCPKVDLV